MLRRFEARAFSAPFRASATATGSCATASSFRVRCSVP